MAARENEEKRKSERARREGTERKYFLRVTNNATRETCESEMVPSFSHENIISRRACPPHYLQLRIMSA